MPSFFRPLSPQGCLLLHWSPIWSPLLTLSRLLFCPFPLSFSFSLSLLLSWCAQKSKPQQNSCSQVFAELITETNNNCSVLLIWLISVSTKVSTCFHSAFSEFRCHGHVLSPMANHEPPQTPPTPNVTLFTGIVDWGISWFHHSSSRIRKLIFLWNGQSLFSSTQRCLLLLWSRLLTLSRLLFCPFPSHSPSRSLFLCHDVHYNFCFRHPVIENNIHIATFPHSLDSLDRLTQPEK